MDPCPIQDWERSRGKPSFVSLRPSPAQYYDRVEIEEGRHWKRGWGWSLEKVTDFWELPPFLWWRVSGGEGGLCFPLTSNWESRASVRLLKQPDVWLLESGQQGLVGDPHLEQPKAIHKLLLHKPSKGGCFGNGSFLRQWTKIHLTNLYWAPTRHQALFWELGIYQWTKQRSPHSNQLHPSG